MESKILRSEKIFKTFKEEWLSSRIWWSNFINNKDLGIRYDYSNKYFITDEKKWMLTKLKYGF